jgi:hypothetical protein
MRPFLRAAHLNQLKILAAVKSGASARASALLKRYGRDFMKKMLAICVAVAAMFVGGNLAAQQAPSRSFTGQIMDSNCAKAGAHNPSMGDAKACTLACVKGGATFVLYNPSTKAIYQLDDQKKPEAFAGKTVKVTGTYDRASKTIHVSDIADAS